jgi:hypothetical protein
VLRYFFLDRTRPRIHARSYEESANVPYDGLLLLGSPHRGLYPQLYSGGERARWEDGEGRLLGIDLEGKPLALRGIECLRARWRRKLTILQEVHIYLFLLFDGTTEVILKFTQRWVKNNKDPENHVYLPSFNLNRLSCRPEY